MAMSFDDLEDLINESSALIPQVTNDRPTVVVIDDDPLIRDSLDFVLSDRYRVVLCASGVEGVDAIGVEVAAVILDVKMSGLDGFETCDRIRAKQPDVPVIFYSAYQDEKDPYRVIHDHRPYGYIIKGDGIDKLLGLLDNAVRDHRLVLDDKARAERP